MQKIKLYFKDLSKSKFIKNTGILVGGTAFSQLISLLTLPILTRLYSPNDFGILAIYTSLVSIVTAISCLRFEIAIPMPKNDQKAFTLLIISLLSVLSITLISIIILFIFQDSINNLEQSKLEGYLWLIPLGIFSSGVYTALQYWAIRNKEFLLIAKTRVIQAVSGGGTQISLGYLSFGAIGLLIGQVLNAAGGIYNLSTYLAKNNFNLLKQTNFNNIRTVFKEYDQFPKYSTIEAFANSGSIQIPIILIAYFAISAEAGFVMLAIRLLSAPMGLIGKAVAQVYLAEASEKYHNGKLKQFTHKTIWSLFKVGSPPLLLAGILAPPLIPIIFGPGWERTGVLITWMVPWFLMQFIASPVSMTLHITSNQRIAMALQISGLILRTGGVLIASICFTSRIPEVYAVSGFLFYTIYLITVLKVLNKSTG